MESGRKDRVKLRKDGVWAGRQMGSSLILCDSVYVCVWFTFTLWSTVRAFDSSVINLDVCQNTHTHVWGVTHLQMSVALGLVPETNTLQTFPFECVFNYNQLCTLSSVKICLYDLSA